MFGQLPTTLTVNGVEKEIRSDYRACMRIMCAFQDAELNDMERLQILFKILYVDDIKKDEVKEALERAMWFLNLGEEEEETNVSKKPLYNWSQDEQIIFSAINKVAGTEVRTIDYMHWWTFISLFMEIGEGTFNTIVSIRNKKNNHKKLEKYEQEYYEKNKSKIDLKKVYSDKDKNDLLILDEILGVKHK